MRRSLITALLICLALAGCAPPAPPVQPSPRGMTPDKLPTSSVPGAPARVKIGVVTFLTGSAARPFGLPARNAAQAIIDSLNRGQAPPPYGQPGIAGAPIELVFVDETGGSDHTVETLRRLYDEEDVDLVIGYISSSDCLAAAPQAEAMKRLLVVFDCGTSRLFEERQYRYVFRTNAHQAIDSIGGARYLLAMQPDLGVIWADGVDVTGINQNYSWGQDSWADFRNTLIELRPGIRIQGEQFPKLEAGDYTAEIQALEQTNAQVIHTSFWGQDLYNFVSQAGQAGLFRNSRLLMTVGESGLAELDELTPRGAIVGAHGPHGPLAPQGPLNDWLNGVYTGQTGTAPTYPVYHMAQAILGVKAAYERAIEAQYDQGRWPSTEQVIGAFEFMSYPSPSGEIRMRIGAGHQAVEPAVYATVTGFDAAARRVRLEQVMVFPAACVNPPDGATTEQWIKDGFPGNDCP